MTNARKGFDLDLRDGVEIENKVLAMLMGGTRLEVKYQPDALRYLFIEVSCRGVPSGISTTEAEWWVIVYAGGRQLIALRTDVLRGILNEGSERGVRTASGGDDGKSVGYIVPITELARRYP